MFAGRYAYGRGVPTGKPQRHLQQPLGLLLQRTYPADQTGHRIEGVGLQRTLGHLPAEVALLVQRPDGVEDAGDQPDPVAVEVVRHRRSDAQHADDAAMDLHRQGHQRVRLFAFDLGHLLRRSVGRVPTVSGPVVVAVCFVGPPIGRHVGLVPWRNGNPQGPPGLAHRHLCLYGVPVQNDEDRLVRFEGCYQVVQHLFRPFFERGGAHQCVGDIEQAVQLGAVSPVLGWAVGSGIHVAERCHRTDGCSFVDYRRDREAHRGPGSVALLQGHALGMDDDPVPHGVGDGVWVRSLPRPSGKRQGEHLAVRAPQGVVRGPTGQLRRGGVEEGDRTVLVNAEDAVARDAERHLSLERQGSGPRYGAILAAGLELRDAHPERRQLDEKPLARRPLACWLPICRRNGGGYSSRVDRTITPWSLSPSGMRSPSGTTLRKADG